MALSLDGDSSDSGEGIVAEINITPLTDIFLVLLIIFMVTSSVMTQMGVEVNLPKASSATAQAQPEGVIVTLLASRAGQAEGERASAMIRVNEEAVPAGDWNRFETLLRTAFGKTASRLVILEGDREAFLGSAIEVMDRSRRAGADRFAIATAPEGGR